MAAKKNKVLSKNQPRSDAGSASDHSSTVTLLRTIFDQHDTLFATVLILVIAVVILHDYLFFHSIYLFKDIGSDSHIALYPTISLYNHYLHTVGFPSWSFQFGIGQDLLPFVLRDPFDIFLYLGSQQQIPYLIIVKEFAKMVGGGLIFFQYVRLVVNDGFSRIVGSLVFAFGGFMLVGSGWHIFSFEAFSLALLLLGFERLYQRRRSDVFVVAVVLIGVSQPFNLFVYGVFLVIYSIARLMDESEEFPWIRMRQLYVRLSVALLIGICISAVFLIPNIIQLRESPRGSGLSSFSASLQSKPIFAFPDLPQMKSVVSRFFSNNLQGIGSKFNGWRNYLEAPLLYISVFALVCVPLGLWSLPRRRRIVNATILALWALPLVFPYFRYGYWLFSGDYYRGYALCLSVVLLFVALRGLSTQPRGSRTAGTILSLVVSAAYAAAIAWSSDTSRASSMTLILSYVCVLVYPALVILFGSTKWRLTAQIIVMLLVSTELVVNGYESSTQRKSIPASDLNRRVDFNDYSLEAIQYVKSIDSSFYRVMKNYSSSTADFNGVDDAMIQNYYGVSVYNSFNQLDYVKALHEMGIINAADEWQSRAINWTGGLLEGLFAVKYSLVRDHAKHPTSFDHDSIATFGDIVVEKNKNWLPLGFCFDHYITKSDFKRMTLRQKQSSFICACFVDDSLQSTLHGISPIAVVDSNIMYQLPLYNSTYQSLRRDTMHITSFAETHIRGELTVNARKILFLSIPADKGWHASVNGKQQDIIRLNGGLMGLILDPGTNTIELQFEHRAFTLSVIGTLLGSIAFCVLIIAESRRKS